VVVELRSVGAVVLVKDLVVGPGKRAVVPGDAVDVEPDLPDLGFPVRRPGGFTIPSGCGPVAMAMVALSVNLPSTIFLAGSSSTVKSTKAPSVDGAMLMTWR
jgi:hypothetical protein